MYYYNIFNICVSPVDASLSGERTRKLIEKVWAFLLFQC